MTTGISSNSQPALPRNAPPPDSLRRHVCEVLIKGLSRNAEEARYFLSGPVTFKWRVAKEHESEGVIFQGRQPQKCLDPIPFNRKIVGIIQKIPREISQNISEKGAVAQVEARGELVILIEPEEKR